MMTENPTQTIEREVDIEIIPGDDNNGTEIIVEEEQQQMVDEAREGKELIGNTENPLNPDSMHGIEMLLETLHNSVMSMQDMWLTTVREYKLNNEHMKKLMDYNREHMNQPPADISEDELKDWDWVNGLNDITDDEIVEIFGAGHPIIGIQHSQTLDRLKSIAAELHAYISVRQEYEETSRSYSILLNMSADMEIHKLEEIAVAEEDPERKADMESKIDAYWKLRFLGFMVDDITEQNVKYWQAGFEDADKLSYLMNRAKEKMRQLNINPNAIISLYQFEERYLSDVKEKINHILWMYFLNTISYANLKDTSSKSVRPKIAAIVSMLEAFDRNSDSKENIAAMMNSIKEFESKVYAIMPKPEYQALNN